MPDSDGLDASATHRSSAPKERYSPANFRARSHDSAHAEATMEDGPRIQHQLVTHAEPEFIDSQDKLVDMLQHLRAAGRFAYDSEFIGELTYIPKLCLIQVASAERIGLIDPLGDLDLTPFWDLLCDPTVEKIVHAGQQDVEPVFRNCGKSVANLFDTQICAGFIGLAYPTSLSKLVLELIGAKLGKGLTFTHWDQRPLSTMQLKYAADDVRYLIAVHDFLSQKLRAQSHTEWAKIECESLCDPTQYGFNPNTNFLRMRGGNSLPPRQQAVLKELTIWRDICARAHNVPPRTFLRDEILIDLSRQPIKNVEKLSRVRGLPRPIEQAHGSEILAATAKGLATPAEELPIPKEADPTPQQRFRADALYAAFLCQCTGQSIDPNLIASRQEVGEFYRDVTAGNSVETHSLFTGWRKEAAGQAMFDFLNGKLTMQLEWNQMLKATSSRK